MQFLWPVWKKIFIYFWDELLYLCIYNLALFVLIAAGTTALLASLQLRPIPILLVAGIGLLIFITVPFLLFGMFWMAYDIGEGKAISVFSALKAGREMARHAYTWAAINTLVYTIMAINLVFYANQQGNLFSILTVFLIGVTIIWTLVQAYALPMYPRLLEPGFRAAQRSGLAVVFTNPLLVLTNSFFVVLILGVGLIVQPILLVAGLSFIIIILNMTAEAIVKDFQARNPESQPPTDEEEPA